MIDQFAAVASVAAGIGAMTTALIGAVVFWLNRGRAEATALSAALAAQRDTETVRASLAALSGAFYVFRDKVAEDAKEYVNREMLRDMEERVLRQVDILARAQSDGLRTVHTRLDEMLRILTATHGSH